MANRNAGWYPAFGACLQTQEFRGSNCVHKQDRRDRGRRGSPPVDHHRMGQGHRAMVDAQDQGITQKRFHHGGEDG